jgi:hypothetical protein
MNVPLDDKTVMGVSQGAWLASHDCAWLILMLASQVFLLAGDAACGHLCWPQQVLLT